MNDPYLSSNKLFPSFLKLLILFTSQLQFPIPPLLFPPSCLPSTPFPSPLSPLRKWQVSQGYQQNMAHQVDAGPRSSSYIKAGQGNSPWEIGSQNPA